MIEYKQYRTCATSRVRMGWVLQLIIPWKPGDGSIIKIIMRKSSMKIKQLSCLIAAAGFTALATGTVVAESLPSAKAGSVISGAALIESTTQTNSWDEVLHSYIKVAQQKELVFDVALECGLYTDTHVKSKGGTKDTSTAEASVKVRVKLQESLGDGTYGTPFYAYPGGDDWGVTYCKRKQDLMAKFQGIFQQCETYDDVTGDCIAYNADTCLIVESVDEDGDGIIDSYKTTLDLECLDYEEIQLVQDTVSANAFNFVSPNLDSGVYRVAVEAEIKTDTDATNGSAVAKGLIGMGSMVVDEKRFIQTDDGIM